MSNNTNNHGLGSLLGAVLVGAAAGAAAVFFSDKKNRETVKSKAKQAKEELQNHVETVKKESDKLKQQGKKLIASELSKAQKKLEESNTRKAKK